VALVHAAIARQVHAFGQPSAPACVLISGGETTVTVRGTGRGGRNASSCWRLASPWTANPSIYAFAGDTDGIDGTETMRARSSAPTVLPAPPRRVYQPRLCSPTMMGTASSPRLEIWWSPANPHQCERFPRHFGPSLRQILVWTIPDLITLARTRKGCCYAAYSRCETRFQF